MKIYTISPHSADFAPQPKTKMLNEIVIIRLLLVVCLVLYHAFAPYAGAWAPLTEESVMCYYWIGKFAYSFFLGSFVFISGYLYAHSESIKGPQSPKRAICKKIKRLIFPSIVFSILYLVLLGAYEGETFLQMMYSIICGRGHMWFLPMLFWLFVGIEVLKRIPLHPLIIIAILLVVAIGATLPLPLRLNSACQYLIFFYIGYWVNVNCFRLTNFGGGIAGVVFILTFVATEAWATTMSADAGIIDKGLLFYMRILYTLVGTIFIYSLAIKLTEDSHVRIPSSLVKMSSYCFGVYLFQQFILQYIYYHTSVVAYTGIYAAPWIGFIVTMPISIGLTYLTLQTRIGRALIG